MPKKDIIFGIILTALLMIFLAPFASKRPDSLERIAQDRGFLGKEKSLLPAVIFGYSLPGIKNEKLSVIIAGILGVIIVFLVSYFISVLIRKVPHLLRLAGKKH